MPLIVPMIWRSPYEEEEVAHKVHAVSFLWFPREVEVFEQYSLFRAEGWLIRRLLTSLGLAEAAEYG